MTNDRNDQKPVGEPFDPIDGDLRIDEEASIHWFVPRDQLPRYVREVTCWAAFRERLPARHLMPPNPVAIAILKPNAKARGDHFHRRVWHLADHDTGIVGSASPYHVGGAPSEGVDPLTITAGELSRQTRRMLGVTS